jgi:hypothetical protein
LQRENEHTLQTQLQGIEQELEPCTEKEIAETNTNGMLPTARTWMRSRNGWNSLVAAENQQRT